MNSKMELNEMNVPIIEVRDLTAKYDDKTILDEISLDIPAHKITVIIGGSGCGKTTLIKNIFKLFQPYSGSVKIFGKEVTTMDEPEYEAILKRIGMLFQNGALLNSVDVYNNIAIPLEQHTKLSAGMIEKLIRIKLDLVNLGEAIYLSPAELSGGMKKRAALARAIALDPEILVCDEPSAGLDPLTSSALDELIMNLKNLLNMTIIMVTHELASIHRVADHVIFLEEGKVIFSGSLEQALISDISEVRDFFKVGKF
jgi:phospholipid/cholesterol/gamma-HCH transport system ATP-binding protein